MPNLRKPGRDRDRQLEAVRHDPSSDSRQSKQRRAIVIGVDTSGSIGAHELEQFAGEISAIAEEAQPESIHVVYCDAAVQSWQQFGPSEPIQLEPKGGGGTDFRPVFEWVEQNQVMPVCLI